MSSNSSVIILVIKAISKFCIRGILRVISVRTESKWRIFSYGLSRGRDGDKSPFSRKQAYCPKIAIA